MRRPWFGEGTVDTESEEVDCSSLDLHFAGRLRCCRGVAGCVRSGEGIGWKRGVARGRSGEGGDGETWRMGEEVRALEVDEGEARETIQWCGLNPL